MTQLWVIDGPCGPDIPWVQSRRTTDDYGAGYDYRFIVLSDLVLDEDLALLQQPCLVCHADEIDSHIKLHSSAPLEVLKSSGFHKSREVLDHRVSGEASINDLDHWEFCVLLEKDKIVLGKIAQNGSVWKPLNSLCCFDEQLLEERVGHPTG